MARDAPPSPYISSTVLVETDVPALISKLHSLLPYPIPLYRRLQFHLKHPNPATARVFLAIASSTSAETWLAATSPDIAPFLAAHIDLSNAGETQIFSFASWELPSDSSTPPTNEAKTALLNALYKTLATNPTFIPSLPAQPPESHQLLMRTKKLVTPYNPSKVLFGAMHSTAFDVIPKHAHARTDPGFVKYIFPPPEESQEEEALAEGYRFGPIKDNDDHLNLVLTRTVIPRTLATLRSLGSVGIFYNGETYPTIEEAESDSQDPSTAAVRGSDTRTAREIVLSANAIDATSVRERLEKINRQPVAWGFLGKDASLTSLHVEPRHRGKGLAGAVTRRLFQMQEEVYGSDGVPNTRMGHADVFVDNTASRRVMEKLGGENKWVVVWAEVDISRLVDADGRILSESEVPQEDIWVGAKQRWNLGEAEKE